MSAPYEGHVSRCLAAGLAALSELPYSTAMDDRTTEQPSDRTTMFSASDFALFAGADLDRWREIKGARFEHRQAFWGKGCIVDVRWGTSGQDIPYYVQLCIAYENGQSVVMNAETWGEAIGFVEIQERLAELIESVSERSMLDPDEQQRRLAAYDAELRERRDAEQLERVARLRERTTQRDLAR